MNFSAIQGLNGLVYQGGNNMHLSQIIPPSVLAILAQVPVFGDRTCAYLVTCAFAHSNNIPILLSVNLQCVIHSILSDGQCNADVTGVQFKKCNCENGFGHHVSFEECHVGQYLHVTWDCICRVKVWDRSMRNGGFRASSQKLSESCDSGSDAKN